MGNRDKGGREVKKAKKKDPRELKSISNTPAIAPSAALPEVVRKKRRPEPEEETG